MINGKAGVEIFSIEISSDYIEKHFELIYALPSMKALTELYAAKGFATAHLHHLVRLITEHRSAMDIY